MTHENYVRNEDAGTYNVNTTEAGDELVRQALEYLVSVMANHEGEMNSPHAVRSYLKLRLARQEREVFAVLLLDNRNRVIHYEELFYGTINASIVHPREVVKLALAHNAAAVILSHNHPSGVAEPSQSDRQITDRLVKALGLVDIRVLDHIIIGGDMDLQSVSFAERGYI